MSHDSISSSLLSRLRTNDQDAWVRLTTLFSPIVLSCCRRANVPPSDAAEIAQEVFISVARGLPSFRRDRPGDSFQGWLVTITRNKIRDHYRAAKKQLAATGGTEAQLRLLNAVDPVAISSLVEADSKAGSREELSQQAGVVQRGAEMVKAEFEPTTWSAFWRTAVEGQTPAEASHDLGVSVNAVYKARSRVLRRLREELDGFV